MGTLAVSGGETLLGVFVNTLPCKKRAYPAPIPKLGVSVEPAIRKTRAL